MTTLRAVWPILDPNEDAWLHLIDEAARDLPAVAARARARITGKPQFSIAPASAVPGSGNVSRFVIVAEAPAVALPPRAYHRAPLERAS